MGWFERAWERFLFWKDPPAQIAPPPRVARKTWYYFKPGPGGGQWTAALQDADTVPEEFERRDDDASTNPSPQRASTDASSAWTEDEATSESGGDGQHWAPLHDYDVLPEETECRLIGDWPQGSILLGASIYMSSAATQVAVTDYLDRVSRFYPDLDIIFVKGVRYRGMVALLTDERIRRSWFTTECDGRTRTGPAGINAILVSRQRFGSASSGMTSVDPKLLGQPWRICYPGYASGALCCDMFTEEGERVRLMNARVDSPLRGPDCHQPHELPIITRCLHDAARGMVIFHADPAPWYKTFRDTWPNIRTGMSAYTVGVHGRHLYLTGSGNLFNFELYRHRWPCHPASDEMPHASWHHSWGRDAGYPGTKLEPSK
jgi:hypothetical protein